MNTCPSDGSLCDVAACPSRARCEGTDELREAMLAVIDATSRGRLMWSEVVADALLAGPLAPLLAKMQAVEALASTLESTSAAPIHRREAADRIRRALGVDRG